jgi:hypothetical protein
MVPRWRVLQANKKKVCLAVLMMGKHVFLLKKNHLSFVRAMMRQLWSNSWCYRIQAFEFMILIG